MSKLILPDSEPVNNQLFVPSRRGFIKGTVLTLASLFVAPTIIKAENLMQINSLQNRLIWAFITNRELDVCTLNPSYPVVWTESALNAKTAWNDEVLKAWKEYNFTLHYEVKRQGEVHKMRTEREKRTIFNDLIEVGVLPRELWIPWIPEPKKGCVDYLTSLSGTP